MKVRGDFLGPPRSTDKITLIIKVSKGATIRNRDNQVPHPTLLTFSGTNMTVLMCKPVLMLHRICRPVICKISSRYWRVIIISLVYGNGMYFVM